MFKRSISSYEEAVEYLYDIPRFTKKNSIEDTRKFLRKLGSPDSKLQMLLQLKSEAEKARKAHNDQIAQQIDDLRNEITNPSNLLQQCQDCIAKLTEELTKDR